MMRFHIFLLLVFIGSMFGNSNSSPDSDNKNKSNILDSLKNCTCPSEEDSSKIAESILFELNKAIDDKDCEKVKQLDEDFGTILSCYDSTSVSREKCIDTTQNSEFIKQFVKILQHTKDDLNKSISDEGCDWEQINDIYDAYQYIVIANNE